MRVSQAVTRQMQAAENRQEVGRRARSRQEQIDQATTEKKRVKEEERKSINQKEAMRVESRSQEAAEKHRAIREQNRKKIGRNINLSV